VKAIDVEVSPFALRSSWRWLTPAAMGALLGVVALAVPPFVNSLSSKVFGGSTSSCSRFSASAH